MKMLVIIYVLGLIILGNVFGYGFLKIIEHLADIDKSHIEKAPDNCPHCNKPYIYVNYHGNKYIEYRCRNCDWMTIYKKNKFGHWEKIGGLK